MLKTLTLFVYHFADLKMSRNPFSDSDSENDEAPTQTITLSPSPRGRAAPVNLYRQSSSAARRLQLKTNHCLFCHENLNRTNLENHLRGSNRCLTLYKRKLSVRSIESILVHSFYCLFCDSRSRSRFQHHLEQSPSCLTRYRDKFNVDSMRLVFGWCCCS